MKNSDLKKRFKNAYQNKRNISQHAKKLSFHFFHISKKKLKKKKMREKKKVRFEPTPILTMQCNELTLYQLS